MKTHVAYSFGAFFVDPAKRELRLGDELVPLQPKAFDCLCYLLQNRDRVVGHDEIISAVWAVTDLNDHALTHSISRARQALGDTGEEQRMIRTVKRVGYGWIMPVEEVEVDVNDNGNGNGNDGQDVRKTRVRHVSQFVARYAAVAALPVAAVAAWLLIQNHETFSEPSIEGEIALVLPVTVEGGDNEAWIRLGIMDFIAERLRKAGQTVVPSDNTVTLVQQYSGRGESGYNEFGELARNAAARMVFHPRAERVDDHWRVSLEVVHGLKRPLIAHGESADVIVAARAAADRVAMMLGHPMVDDIEPETPGLENLLQRVKAARLSDRLDEAHALLKGVDPSLRSHPRIRYANAEVDDQAGRRTEAEAAFRALIQDFSPDREPLVHAKAQVGLGNVLMRQDRMAGAEAAYSTALELVETLEGYEARYILGQSYMGRVIPRIVQQDYSAAQTDLSRARTAFSGIGDQLALAKIDAHLVILLTSQRRYSEVIPHSRRALERVQAFGDLQSELRIRGVLARTYLQLLDAPAALSEMRQLDELLTIIDNPGLVSTVNLYRVEILFENGALRAADEFLAQELKRGLPGARAAEVLAADHALALGEPESALRFARSALQRTWGEAIVHTKGRVWLILFRAYLQSGQLASAAETADSALAWAATQDHPAVALDMVMLQAEYAAARGDHDAARTYFERALELAAASAGPIELLQATDPYVNWLITQGDLDRASVVAGGVASWDATSYNAALLQLRVYHALGDATAWRQVLNRTQALAGERQIPVGLLSPPAQVAATPLVPDPR